MTNNEIIQDIMKLRYISVQYDVDALGRMLNEIRIKYGMDESIEISAIINKTPVSYVNLTTSSYNELRALAGDYISILENRLSITYASNFLFSDRAIRVIFYNNSDFYHTQPLHSKNGLELKVSDVLAVIGYAKDIYESLGGKVDDRINYTLMVLNSIELALNNKKQDKPINKLLHLTVDVLSDVYKKAVADEQAGRFISVSSIIVNLTIDFLVKE
jgi:hypothetical protein